MKKTQYFIYGILVSYERYLEMETYNTIDDVLNGNDDIQGIFTGRDNNFMIIGKILKTIEPNDKEPYVVPELDDIELITIKTTINKKHKLHGEFHYYFVTKT